MTINLKLPDVSELKPRITVVGVGGAGGNAVNNMIESKLEGVEFAVANTDAQALTQSAAERRIQMGTALTEGLGAGSEPQIGAAAAEEAMPEIIDHLAGSHMVFITAGMGGGTGTGAAPVIARASRDQGILTVGVVTKPFHFEGQRRMETADEGISQLAQFVDTLIVIPNQNLFRVANEKTTFADAFAMADQVLYSGVAGVTDLMVKEGLINLDFADVRAIMSGMGKAMMGTGEATGEKRSIEAAEAAISNPLLDDVSMRGARGLLISITGGRDLTLYEVDEAATRIREEVDPEANIILGATFDEALEGVMRVSVVATGVDGLQQRAADDDHYDIAAEAAGVVPPHLAEEAMQAEPGLAPEPVMADPAADMAAMDDLPPPAYPELDAETAQGQPAPMPAAQMQNAVAPEGGQMPAEMPAANDSFIPPEPAEAPAADAPPPARAELPRMPAVEDFPPIAARQLRAREGEVEEVGVAAQKKRAGFFERLANVGLGRKEEPKPAEPIEPSFGASPSERPAQAPAAQRDGAGSSPYLKAIDGLAEPEFEDDTLEIPAFLRRQAN